MHLKEINEYVTLEGEAFPCRDMHKLHSLNMKVLVEYLKAF